MTDTQQQQQPPDQAQPEQGPAETQPVNTGQAVPGPAPRDPNRRVETIVKEWVSKRRALVVLGLVLSLVLVGGCVWVRSGTDAPAAADVAPLLTEAAVEERLQQAKTEWEQALPPTPDVDALVNQRVAAERASWAVAAAPSPYQIPAKLDAYTEYRYYHFLEEYRMCLGPQPAAVVDIAAPPRSEDFDAVSADTEPGAEDPAAAEGTGEEADTQEPDPAQDLAQDLEPTPTPEPTPEPALEMRPELELELETLQALPQAVDTLLAMYDAGKCVERDDYAIYRGRGTWLRQWR